MTEPAHSSTDRTLTATPGGTPLDPTLVRPEEGSAAPPSRREFDFGPPEQGGDLGKLGRYRVLKKLGAGGMGAVYLGTDTVLARRVALKLMLPHVAADPEAKERFTREARTAATVRSDHVVTIFDVGEDRGVPFIAMEYLSGYPLDRFLREHGHPSLAHVVRIGRETALGLAAAHKLGLIHRDIKPGNVWLEAPRGRVKILDFGLARPADDAELTAPGQVVGTPAYMSPEQARNLKLDPRSDLFSLGVMLYRLAAGKLPFEGGSTGEVLARLVVDEPVPPRRLKPAIPPGLEAVVLKLLAKRPADRYPSARAAADALAELERHRPAEHPSTDAVPMVIPVPLDAGGAADDSGSRPRVLAEMVEAAPERSTRPVRRKEAAGRPVWLVPAVAGAACAALAALALFLWPAKGTLVVESDDPEAELVIKKDGAVVRDRTRDRALRLRAGAYTAELADPRPGRVLAPERFEVTPRQPARVRVTVAPAPPPLPPPGEGDRPAAEYALALGGTVRTEGGTRDITAAADLPKGPFRLRRVDLSERKPTDAGLAVLARAPGLAELILDRTPVTDAGLAHLKGCRALARVDLSGTAVTDAGLPHLSGCSDLRAVEVRRTRVTRAKATEFSWSVPRARVVHHEWAIEVDPDRRAAQYALAAGGSVTVQVDNRVFDPAGPDELPPGPFRLVKLNLSQQTRATDAGLVAVTGCRHLRLLYLNGSRVTDAGLAHFAGVTTLRHLLLYDTATTDAGLEHFKGCAGLDWLSVAGTKVGDRGLRHLRGCRELTNLDVSGTRVGDAGVAFALECPQLNHLLVQRTFVSAELVRRFRSAFPGCQIECGGDPPFDPDFKAAEYALAMGGSVAVETDAGVKVRRGADRAAGRPGDPLPPAPYALTEIDLRGNRNLADGGLAAMRGTVNLVKLDLSGSVVGDRGLAFFDAVPNLTHLDLSNTAATDAGLRPFEGCRHLKVLDVTGTAVTAAAVQRFRDAGCEVRHGPKK
jgi:tRNA A-37 threonylcarbamoyl transferase component Bud32